MRLTDDYLDLFLWGRQPSWMVCCGDDDGGGDDDGVGSDGRGSNEPGGAGSESNAGFGDGDGGGGAPDAASRDDGGGGTTSADSGAAGAGSGSDSGNAASDSGTASATESGPAASADTSAPAADANVAADQAAQDAIAGMGTGDTAAPEASAPASDSTAAQDSASAPASETTDASVLAGLGDRGPSRGVDSAGAGASDAASPSADTSAAAPASDSPAATTVTSDMGKALEGATSGLGSNVAAASPAAASSAFGLGGGIGSSIQSALGGDTTQSNVEKMLADASAQGPTQSDAPAVAPQNIAGDKNPTPAQTGDQAIEAAQQGMLKSQAGGDTSDIPEELTPLPAGPGGNPTAPDLNAPSGIPGDMAGLPGNMQLAMGPGEKLMGDTPPTPQPTSNGTETILSPWDEGAWPTAPYPSLNSPFGAGPDQFNPLAGNTPAVQPADQLAGWMGTPAVAYNTGVPTNQSPPQAAPKGDQLVNDQIALGMQDPWAPADLIGAPPGMQSQTVSPMVQPGGGIVAPSGLSGSFQAPPGGTVNSTPPPTSQVADNVPLPQSRPDSAPPAPSTAQGPTPAATPSNGPAPDVTSPPNDITPSNNPDAFAALDNPGSSASTDGTSGHEAKAPFEGMSNPSTGALASQLVQPIPSPSDGGPPPDGGGPAFNPFFPGLGDEGDPLGNFNPELGLWKPQGKPGGAVDQADVFNLLNNGG